MSNSTSMNKISCAVSGRSWLVPNDMPAHGSLRLTAQPPDDVPAGTRVWLAGGSVGVGTNQRPCRPVEITVGGQRPFWYIGADDGSD